MSEIVPSLDQFVSLDCDDTNSETDSRTATIRVEANEIVRCVWVNRDSPARVVIEKQAPAVHLPLREPLGNFEHNFFGSTANTGLIASGERPRVQRRARHLHRERDRTEPRAVRQTRLRRHQQRNQLAHRDHPRRSKRNRPLRLGQRGRRGSG